MKTSYELLNDPFLNKGTAFTMEEREEYNLTGLLPPFVQTIEEQARQAYGNVCKKTSDIEKRHYLMDIFGRNRTLFYYLFSRHIVEFMPIVYDPVVAEAIKQYSEFYIEPQNAAYLSIDHPQDIKKTLINAANGREINLIVVTDAEMILGIGDWGTNGVEISVGKLAVYTAAAGIDPNKVLPVVLDVGTNRQSLLDDPLYFGNRHERVRGDRYYEFVDRFVKTAEEMFPHLYLHFEDFGRSNAAVILNRYKDTYTVFNDDIEGTGIISLAGILGALNISGQKLREQTYMCFGAGTAGCGIANRVYQEMLDQGVPEDEGCCFLHPPPPAPSRFTSPTSHVASVVVGHRRMQGDTSCAVRADGEDMAHALYLRSRPSEPREALDRAHPCRVRSNHGRTGSNAATPSGTLNQFAVRGSCPGIRGSARESGGATLRH